MSQPDVIEGSGEDSEDISEQGVFLSEFEADLVEGQYDNVNEEDQKCGDEDEEVEMVLRPDAVVQPFAVMVVPVHTLIAYVAMSGPLSHYQLTLRTQHSEVY